MLVNLLAAYRNAIDPDRFVAISFRRADYIGSELDRDALASIRDHLAASGLIDHASGFLKVSFYEEKPLGRLSRLRSGPRLREIFEHHELQRDCLTIPTAQLIRLKAPHIDTPSKIPSSIEASRQLLLAVNHRLASAEIRLEPSALLEWRLVCPADDGEDEDERNRKRRYAGDLTATSLYRSFKGDWFSGGRLYGGWWMSLPKNLRHRITLNGAKVVELDYRALHPTLLYRRVGLRPLSDPYSIQGFDGPEMRNLGKRTFNRLLNRIEADPDKRLKMRAAKGDKSVLGNASFRQYLDCFVNQLSDIQPWFGTGEGVRLQREDSELALDVLAMLEEQAISVLPIHDSFIVADCHASALEMAMKEAFTIRYGVIPAIDSKASNKRTSALPLSHNWVG